ncbi:MAG TPA: hypothetical protein VGK00_01135, partial [Anaerolineales bacterium]
GFQMYIGYHPQGDGGFVSQLAFAPMAILDDNLRDETTLAAAISFIRENPGDALVRVVRRAAFFLAAEDRELLYFYSNGFFGEIPQPALALAYLVIVLPWMGVCLLAAPGLLLALTSRSSRAIAWLALTLIAGYALPHLLIIAEPRFHLALVPVLIPFAALGWSRRKEAMRILLHASGLTPWLLRLALLALLVFWIWGFALNWDRILMVMSPGGSNARFYY